MKTASAILGMIMLALCLMAATPDAPAVRPVVPKDNYVREATFVRVIDGDTIVLNIYLGDGVTATNRHIRMSEVYSPERFTPEGVSATANLKKLIDDRPGQPISVQLLGNDKYGRVVGVVWCGDTNLCTEQAKLPQGGKGIK